MNCNTTHYRANSSSVPGDPTDTNTDAEAVEQFKEASAAYAVLSDPALRRDYDGVRDAIAAGREHGVWSGWGTGRPPAARGEVPRFQPARPSGRGFTRRRAWIATVGGVVVTVLGLAAGFWTLQLHDRDAARRAHGVAVRADRVVVNGHAFVSFDTASGEHVQTPEPKHLNPGLPGAQVKIRYDPADPRRVVIDEGTFGRDITLAIVALKLIIGGPVFFVLGRRRLRAFRTAELAVP